MKSYLMKNYRITVLRLRRLLYASHTSMFDLKQQVAQANMAFT